MAAQGSYREEGLSRDPEPECPHGVGGSGANVADRELAFASANVCTLQCSSKFVAIDEAMPSARVQLLEMAFDREGFDIVGIQEGRVKPSQQKSGIVYEQFIASADGRGQYGSQIWVRRGSDFKVQRFYPKSPRLVHVVGTPACSEQNWDIVSGHAPCEDAENDKKDDFGDSLRA